jgi:hypothetical protein
MLQRAPATLRVAYSSILKRNVNIDRSLKRSSRQLAQTRQSNHHQNSTIALARTNSRNSDTPKLSWSQVQSLLIASSIPMVGFGFMDNFVMIQAGGYIDSTIGVRFGMATLTAAAMGQVVSDVSGVVFGGYLERWMSPWIKPSSLTSIQQQLPIVGRIRLVGAVGGVIVGCMLGASSLYFVLNDDSPRPTNHLKQLQGIIGDMLSQKGGFQQVACTLYLKDATHTVQDSKDSSVVVTNLEKATGLASDCSQRRECLLGENSIFIPVTNSSGNILAVLELTKKTDVFSMDQQDAAKSMAAHMGIFLHHTILSERSND